MSGGAIELLGLVRVGAVSGDDVAALGLKALKIPPFIAIARMSGTQPSAGDSRKAVMQALLDHQRVMEKILARTGFLAVQPRTVFSDLDDLMAFLTDAEQTLAELVDTYAGCEQHQVVVSWRPEAMLRRLPTTDEGKTALDRAGRARSKIEAAGIIRDTMEAWRERLARQFEAALRSAGEDLLTLPLGDPDHVFNGVALVRRHDEAAIESALQDIDEAHPDALRIRMIGPLPACSFASIGRRNADRHVDTGPFETLGLTPAATPREARHAWIELARSEHPDVGSGSTDIMARLNSAYDRVKSLLGRGGVESDAQPVVDVACDPERGRAA